MRYSTFLGCLVLVVACAMPSECAYRYSMHHKQEPQGFTWFSPYALAKFAILGAGISWAAWKIYKYFVFTCDDAQQLCNSLELYVQDIHNRYARELKFVVNDDVMTVKKELQAIITEQCGRFPYFSYVNRLNNEVEKCKEQLNAFDNNVSLVHELSRKVRNDLNGATDSRVITDLENQFLRVDQIETRLRELKSELLKFRQNFEMLMRLTMQFPEYEQDRLYMRVNKD